ncbi:hypothetical protein BBBOND_0304560 [Babesia bigemina]|uniref:Uncharacterized protein n=1 Tax=Babesia bigemina TaxID=5866 RepID=A0A061D7N2_BABBI|nr:hypothetical protein BBBOND_0304560 [Babesia bigemina]CDR96553.1 hypothetical protein BBBOND_0304560 [Babesia bigemina]|eukprot:XP_012768739.1 hypothetical protein BBBOND_0304560 [Babesia bigemina]
MAPKKLTDCPENLREAIDWLIQVRHGNGGDGQGLKNLAEALKRLIEEAISNAYDSLNKQYLLAKPPSTVASASSTTKPTGSATPEKKSFADIKKDIEKQVEELPTNISELQKESANDPPRGEEATKLSAKLQALKTVKKLAEFAEQLDTKKHPNNNILTHLCDGLEKFLGFDPTSKGYTGKGIVYSDLDRLCDGVMAFLLSCLEGSKDLLTHYNRNTTHVIGHLKSSIGKGSGVSGFASAIEKVKEGLQGYERELNTRSDKVADDVTLIYRLSGKYKADMESSDFLNKDITRQINDIKQKAQFLWNAAAGAGNDTDLLDHGLQLKLKIAVDRVKQAVNVLKDVSNNDHVMGQAAIVDRELVAKNREIVQLIESQTHNVRKALGEGFGNIVVKIDELGEVKGKQIQSVKHKVNDAKDSVGELLGDFQEGYKSVIERLFSELKDYMNNINRNTPHGSQGRSFLKEEFTAVTSAVEEIEAAYQGKLIEVKADVERAVGRVLIHLTQVDGSVRHGLLDIRNKIKQNLVDFCNQVGNNIKDAAKKAGTNVYDTNYPAVKALGTQLQNTLQRFGSTITELTNGGSNGIATCLQALLYYIDNPPSATAIYADLVASIRRSIEEAIDAQLKKVIQDAGSLTFGQNLMNEYNEETKEEGALSNRLRKKIEEIKKHVGYMKLGDAEVDVESFLGYKHTEARKNDNKGAKPRYENYIRIVLDKIDDLEALPSAVDEAKNVALKKTDELIMQIETLKSDIEMIEKAVQKADERMTMAIEALSNAYTEAERKCRQTVDQFREKLLETVRSTFRQIKTSVQSLFAKQKQAELATLENVIQLQLDEIKRVIQEDRENDLKGYWRKLNTGLKKHLDIPSNSPDLINSTTLKMLAPSVLGFLDDVLDYVFKQVQKSSLPSSSLSYPTIVDGIKNNLNILLGTLSCFNKTSSDHIEALKKPLASLVPDKFDGHNNHLLDLIRDGVKGFVEQLEYAYISVYSEATIKWKSTTLPDALASAEDALTENAMKCAKVFLTNIHTLHSELSELKDKCEKDWTDKQINLVATQRVVNGRSQNMTNSLGDFLKRCGFDVSTGPHVCNAELANKRNMIGSDVFNLLVVHGSVFIRQTTDDGTADESVMYKVLKHLHDYYKTCHLGNNKSTKHPSTVRDMLHWLCGLFHNPVLGKVELYFKELFQKPDALKDVPYDAIDATKLRLSGTTTIQPHYLTTELYKVCSHSEKVLIAILGYGHAGGRYACEYNTNPDNLDYPTDPSKCFDWLVEVLVRLHHQLSFLYHQCCNGTSSSGWLDCLYGKDVGGSSWRCNELKCTEPSCGITCKRHPRCGMKSPLQSFLEDGLPGFLPHKFEKPDCKITCSLVNHHGIPCKTPMGFADISTVASHTAKGQHLMKVLAGFCSKSDRPLTKLCSYLVCVLQRPPQTLDEMYAFYYNFIYGWGDLQNSEHKSNAFNRAVNEASFNRGITLDVTQIADRTAHGEHHVRGDLFSLVSCNDRSSPVSPCGPYLHPLSLNVRCIYSKEHADKYLSWIVYLTETFYNALCRLLSKCEAKCGANISKCRSERCASDCQMLKSATHSSSCQSILECPHTFPGLYTEGIVFGSTTKLGGRIGNPWKRSCGDFIDQLKKVCRGKTILAEYVHIIIPYYLYKIRAPFIWTTVALWLLSLLYLLHIMVIRLDLLHIKSHLHSPSSHRIAAQSLLAAARVKALNKVLYLQP